MCMLDKTRQTDIDPMVDLMLVSGLLEQHLLGIIGVEDPPGMTPSRLSQPPRTPPACLSTNSFSGIDMVSSTVHGLFTLPEMLNSCKQIPYQDKITNKVINIVLLNCLFLFLIHFIRYHCNHILILISFASWNF